MALKMCTHTHRYSKSELARVLANATTVIHVIAYPKIETSAKCQAPEEHKRRRPKPLNIPEP